MVLDDDVLILLLIMRDIHNFGPKDEAALCCRSSRNLNAAAAARTEDIHCNRNIWTGSNSQCADKRMR